MPKPLLVLDFDGVIHSYTSGWTDVCEIRDDPVPGALNFIREALDHFEVAIFSTRSGHPGGVEAMQQWLEKHGLEAEFRERMLWPVAKPPAYLTIDDRALLFTGTFPEPSRLKSFRTWNKGTPVEAQEFSHLMMEDPDDFLAEMSILPHPHKVLVCAPSGTGKTAMIGSLAKADYRCFVQDFDAGIEILLDPSILPVAKRKNVFVKTYVDKPLTAENGIPLAAKSAMADLSNGWIEKGQNLGTPSRWGVKDVLFLDTLGFFGDACLRFVQAINNHFDRASIPDYGTAMEMVEKYLETVFSPVTTCNVVVNSHVMFTGAPEQQGVQKGFPLALGSKLPPKVPRYFNSMLSLEKRKGDKGETKVVLCTQMTPALDLKTPAPSIIPAEMSPDLAMFFRFLDSVQVAPPVAQPAA